MNRTKGSTIEIEASAPTIECKDILLREFAMADLDELYNLTLQAEITDFLPDWKGTKEEYEDWLENVYIKGNKEFLRAVPKIVEEAIIFGIHLKETDEFIGWCFTAPNDELADPNREIGYAISKHHRNKGYTTQAVQGLIQYLLKETDIKTLNALALVDNQSSNRVIEKCGFEYIDVFMMDHREFNRYIIFI